MRVFQLVLVSYLLSLGVLPLRAERATIIVAQDGSGHYRTIQAALDAVPAQHDERIIILIKRGTYGEKLFITKSNIALVGEDRDSTRIVFPQLRSAWHKDHGQTDNGAATVNIDSTVTDLTLANLTIYNNYGSLTGVYDHQFAIYGTGTRIILLNCNVIADGGDTVSLWNRTKGMYYHAYCYFEGGVDFVCPRGWCYITDSKFYSRSISAAIWHDGSNNKNQKFVIRYSFFDGIPNFPLGRNHRDGQIYLLDCIFSRTMADIPIYYPPTTTSGPWKWGARHYYFNCHREGGDYDWFSDNLQTAENSPTPEQVTAAWTFDGMWDPEESLPSVLPFVSMPRPRNGTYLSTRSSVQLKWLPSRNARTFQVYIGKVPKYTVLREPSLELFTICEQPLLELEKLEAGVTYYWRVDEITSTDTLRGPVWHFTIR